MPWMKEETKVWESKGPAHILLVSELGPQSECWLSPFWIRNSDPQSLHYFGTKLGFTDCFLNTRPWASLVLFTHPVFTWTSKWSGNFFLKFIEPEGIRGGLRFRTVRPWSPHSQSLHYTLCFAAATAKSLQSCPTLCDPIDGSPPGFPIPGILQARTLEWVAISVLWVQVKFTRAFQRCCFVPDWKYGAPLSTSKKLGLRGFPGVKVKFVQSSDSLWPHRLWNSLGQNDGVGSLSLLQGIFPTQGSNPGLPHCRQIL